MSEPLILLVGEEAEALAARLEASGYTCSTAARTPPTAAPADPAPDAVLLSADQADRIPALRAQWGDLPLLLDVGEDTVEARVLCLSSGANDFWLSSLGPSDLLMRLRLHLDLSRRTNIPVQLLQVGGRLPHHQSVVGPAAAALQGCLHVGQLRLGLQAGRAGRAGKHT